MLFRYMSWRRTRGEEGGWVSSKHPAQPHKLRLSHRNFAVPLSVNGTPVLLYQPPVLQYAPRRHRYFWCFGGKLSFPGSTLRRLLLRTHQDFWVFVWVHAHIRGSRLKLTRALFTADFKHLSAPLQL